MGGTYSEPVRSLVGEGYVAFIFRSYDKLRILHANAQVHEIVVRIVRDVSSDQDVVTESKYGSVQFRLPGSPFSSTCGKDSAKLGKVFTQKLLEELFVAGYDLLTCADLSRAFDQGTLIFKQTLISGERPRKTIIGVAPYGTDKLHLINCSDGVVQTVLDAIGASWHPGIQSQSENDNSLCEVKMKGNPWSSESSDESLMARRMLIEIVGGLSTLNWKFHAAINIRHGCGNCLFFIYDERHCMMTSDLAVLSPSEFSLSFTSI